jgi:GDP-D-mannose dehydratase
MNISITGFVGQYLVDFFLRKKFNVYSLGRSEVSNVKNYILPKKWNQNLGYWLDIGRPDDYDIAVNMFENNSKFF